MRNAILSAVAMTTAAFLLAGCAIVEQPDDSEATPDPATTAMAAMQEELQESFAVNKANYDLSGPAIIWVELSAEADESGWAFVAETVERGIAAAGLPSGAT